MTDNDVAASTSVKREAYLMICAGLGGIQSIYVAPSVFMPTPYALSFGRATNEENPIFERFARVTQWTRGITYSQISAVNGFLAPVDVRGWV